MNPWSPDEPRFFRGGRYIVRADRAPLGRLLPYRRSHGQPPPENGGHSQARRRGWAVDLGERGLGDLLLGLSLARALVDATGRDDLSYVGPRADLMRLCSLPLCITHASGPSVVYTDGRDPVRFTAVPEQPAAWLDRVDDEHTEVHASLPMRYYLAAEQALGVRLPASHAPAPAFAAPGDVQPFRIVFIGATSWPDRKNYGVEGFAAIASALIQRCPTAPWRFTLITGTGPGQQTPPLAALEVTAAPTLADCLGIFASAQVVIGNDTGLTHLAALARRDDATSPHVIGLYGRHAHTKWTTGADHHHAVATPFSQMLAAADRCPVRDHLDDAAWGPAAALTSIPAELIAEYAGHVAGWW
jgi:Glycosyltransferase family 9 (heptosyltransferase)